MDDVRVLVTGFGPFLAVDENPSGALARALADASPPGVCVSARVLPVSFAGAPRALDSAWRASGAMKPAAILALGVQREDWYRLERRARCVLDSRKPDAEGFHAVDLGSIGYADLASPVELEPIVAAMRGAGAHEARISDDAGGYVCERTYYAALELGRSARIPAIFLHLPPVERRSVGEQLPVVRAALIALAASIRTPSS